MLQKLIEELFRPLSKDDKKKRVEPLFSELHALADELIAAAESNLKSGVSTAPYRRGSELEYVDRIMNMLDDMVSTDVISIDTFSVARTLSPSSPHYQFYSETYNRDAIKWANWIKKYVTP